MPVTECEMVTEGGAGFSRGRIDAESLDWMIVMEGTKLVRKHVSKGTLIVK